MIKNVVFDLGGVVVRYAPKKFLSKRFSNTELENFLYETIFASEEWKKLDKGVMQRVTANKEFMRKGAEINRAFEVQAVLDEWIDIMVPISTTIQLIKRLKINGYNVYYLSNIPKDVLEYFEEDYNFMQLFVGGVASCDVHILKPDEEIYKTLLVEYKLNAEETVFCDDTQANVDAANRLGIQSFRFTDADSFEAELNRLGVNTEKVNALKTKPQKELKRRKS